MGTKTHDLKGVRTCGGIKVRRGSGSHRIKGWSDAGLVGGGVGYENGVSL